MNFSRTAFIAQVCFLSLILAGCGSDTTENPAPTQENSQGDEAAQDEEANTELDQDQEDPSDSGDETTPGDETEPEEEPEGESPWITEEDLNAMKVVNSLKTAKKRHRNCRIVRRRGRVYVINKTNRRFKARQG